jgi:hypothetical protein
MRFLVATALFLSAVAKPALADDKLPPDIAAAVASLNQHFQSEWSAKSLKPAGPVNDAGYLRRIYLDLTGTLPPPERIHKFLNSEDQNKRTEAVDSLLASSDYATRWANYWDAVLMGRVTESAILDRGGFKTWLHEQWASNSPWDKIVAELLTAEGWNTNRQPGNSNGHPPNQAERYAPAVNWFLKHWQSLPELSSSTSKTFLGVQLQCAQCHDHKTEKWTQEDYRQFTAFFVKTWPTYFDKALVVGTPRVEVTEHFFVPPITARNEKYLASYKDYVKSTPKLLSGEAVSTWGSRRQELARWVTAKDNLYFAKAFVNRLWAVLLGRGFVEPIDDFRPTNPAILPEALDLLAADFAEHDFDIHRLIRIVCASRPYQLAAQARSASEGSEHLAHDLWSSYPIKQLEVEVLLQVVLDATGAAETLNRLSNKNLELVRSAFARQFVTQISNDDSSETANVDETIPRALLMLNGPLFCGTSRVVSGLSLENTLSDAATDRERIQRLYELTLSRQPRQAESDRWVAIVSAENELVSTPGASSDIKFSGLAALVPSAQIAAAPPDADFSELLKHAKTGVDFKLLYSRMKNNADAGQYVRALREFAAEAPFRALMEQGAARTAKDQAFEDLHWALLNCTEFLTNH